MRRKGASSLLFVARKSWRNLWTVRAVSQFWMGLKMSGGLQIKRSNWPARFLERVSLSPWSDVHMKQRSYDFDGLKVAFKKKAPSWEAVLVLTERPEVWLQGLWGRNWRRKHLSQPNSFWKIKTKYEKMSQVSNHLWGWNNLSTDCRNYHEDWHNGKGFGVIPVYNVERSIYSSVGSLEQQTYSNIENHPSVKSKSHVLSQR